jgi:hypothetical protein
MTFYKLISTVKGVERVPYDDCRSIKYLSPHKVCRIRTHSNGERRAQLKIRRYDRRICLAVSSIDSRRKNTDRRR